MCGDSVRLKRNKRLVSRVSQSGFSILEMLLASAIMMVGIISVVQLVPASLQLNASNGSDASPTRVGKFV
jgi:Tfp pilus assembly protein PilV